MKTLFTLTCMTFLGLVALGQHTWGIINDGNGNSTNSIHFFNEMEGYYPSGSTLHFTEDGGETSTEMPGINMLQHYLSSACFFNKNEGFSIWVKFSDKTFKFFSTADGGDTWTEEGSNNYSSTHTSVGFFSHLTFFDANLAYSWGKAIRVSDNENISILMVSTDGGTTWDMKQVPLESGEVYDVVFVNSNDVYCANSNKIYKSTDGGDSWTELIDLTYQVFDLEFVNSNTAFALVDANSPTIYKTTDGGSTWTDLAPDLSPPGGGVSGKIKTLRHASFLNENEGVVGSTTNQSIGAVLRTSDGGNTWVRDSIDSTLQQITGSWSTGQVFYVSADVQYGLTSGHLIRTGEPAVINHVQTKEAVDLQLFPNPTSGRVIIKSSMPIKNIAVFDLSGKKLAGYQSILNSFNQQIDLQYLTNGMYLLQCEFQNGKTINKKLIINN